MMSRALLLLLAAALLLGAFVACGSSTETTSGNMSSSGDGSNAPPGPATIPDPPDGGPITWSNWVSTFSNDYCVSCHNPTAPCGGSGCHNAGDPLLFDMRQESSFVSRASTIRCGVAKDQDPAWGCGSTVPETYPKIEGDNPLPTDAQRATVVGWIDAGCP